MRMYASASLRGGPPSRATRRSESISCYVSPSDHTLYLTLDADDSRALAKALAPINALGVGNTSPVLPLDDVLAMAEAGEFS